MRQLSLKLPKGHHQEVVKALEKLEGQNTMYLPTNTYDVFVTYLPNNEIGNFIEALENIKEAEINLIPRGLICLCCRDILYKRFDSPGRMMMFVKYLKDCPEFVAGDEQ